MSGRRLSLVQLGNGERGLILFSSFISCMSITQGGIQAMKWPYFQCLFCLLLAISLLGPQAWAAGGAVKYVAPHGHDSNPGTYEAPWGTPAKAAAEAKAGDIIYFLPGDYTGVLRPRHSGEASSPIRFISLEPGKARLRGRRGGDFVVQLVNVEHIQVEGFHIDPAYEDGRWVLIESSKFITIANNLMENSLQGSIPFFVEAGTNIFLRGNTLRRMAPDRKTSNPIRLNLIRFSYTNKIVLEGNTFGCTVHGSLDFQPPGSTKDIVVRGNVFHAEWSRNFEFFGSENVLFEGNLLTDSFKGGYGGSSSKFMVAGGIFRFNQIIDNPGAPLRIFDAWFREEDKWDKQISHLRLYNNVFVNNLDYGISLTIRANMQDVLFVNNIFYRNDLAGDGRQIELTDARPEEVRFQRNAIRIDEERPFTGSIGQSHLFTETLDAPPGFVDVKQNNYALRADSPLRDAGLFLTHALTSGSGNVIAVADAVFFYDGFGIPGESGDLVAVGSPHQVARVLAADWELGTLELDRSITWQAGDPVSLVWDGKAPDIGLYEHGSAGRGSVQVLVTPAQQNRGLVELKAVIHGNLLPVSFSWQLGDGTTAQGAVVQHCYDKAGNYPIKVRITDKAGRHHWGTAYVVVEPERDPSAPLLCSTFNIDDSDWWWRWRIAEPAPTNWRVKRDPESGNGILVVEAPGGSTLGTLPALLRVEGWDIDAYPFVKIRYAIVPGTPLGLYLEGFGNRHVVTAATLTHLDTAHPQAGRTYLLDDGEWHEQIIDVRVIREIYPEVKVMEGIGFRTGSRLAAPPSGFQLDEFAILPASYRLPARPQVVLATPRPQEEVSGQIPLKFTVQVPKGVALRSVVVNFAGTTVYKGQREPNELMLDTLLAPDGTQLLYIQVETEDGECENVVVSLQVNNWWEQIDPLDPPAVLGFLGTVKRSFTAAESAGWAFTEGDAHDFFGESIRKIRRADTEEFLQWDIAHLKKVEAVVFAQQADITDCVIISVAEVRDEWQTLDTIIEEKDISKAGWRKFTATAYVPPHIDVQQLRLTIPAGKIAADQLQIGQVRMEGLRESFQAPPLQ